jgi:iron complex outermembrane receptor protein
VNASVTDAAGRLTVAVTQDPWDIVITKDGYMPVSTTVVVVGEVNKEILVGLQPAPEEQVTVSATRTGGRLEDQPMRVEVLGREEIEEKLLMTPGDIVMMLNEMGGMRVQATSPSLGAASVRVQGMNGRYTRFLSDGLPLFGEQVGALGLLQIPPMDLGQVEVIKGVASSLYGAGAMGGSSTWSRRPGNAERTPRLTVSRGDRRDRLTGAALDRVGPHAAGGGHCRNRRREQDTGRSAGLFTRCGSAAPVLGQRQGAAF